MSGDIFYGIVPLPDGRQCQAVVRGINTPNSWDEKGGFEIAADDPLEIENIDGVDPDDSEYEKEYVFDGKGVTLEDFCIDWLIEHGKFEGYAPDYD